jgi:hypothetical protein
MSTEKPRAFPRVNFVALITAALFLVSIFLSWWGFTTSGFGVTEPLSWSLWSGPSGIYNGSSSSASTLTTYSPLIGSLVIAAVVLLVLGMLPRASLLMIGSSAVAIVAPILYAIVVTETVSNGCSGMSNCLSGAFGTRTVGTGGFSFTVNWGFQVGFYVEIVGAVFSIIALAFQRTYLATKTP